MVQDDVIIEVVDKQTVVNDTSVDYQPFGVKVLKLRVRRNPVTRPSLGPIWIHPLNYARPNAASDDPNQWRAYGTADDDPDLWVVWGAGDESGFCVKTSDPLGFSKSPANLDDDDDHFVYLHLIHRPRDPMGHALANKMLTIIATSQDNHGRVLRDGNGRTRRFGQLKVNLTVPEQAKNPIRAVWAWDDSLGASVIRLQAAAGQPAQSPRYVSRWWPGRRVHYDTVDAGTAAFLAQLRLVYTRQADGKDQSRITLYHGDNCLALLSGDIGLPLHDVRLFSAELMRFPDDHHLVLRFWFYWVHLNFTAEQLLAHAPPDRRDEWQAEAQRVRQKLQGGVGAVPWRKREEIPDVERFDLVLGGDDFRRKFVGSDTHWQEFWAKVATAEPLTARIAGKWDIPWVVAQAKDVPKAEPAVFNPLANGLCDLINESGQHQCPYRGQGRLIKASRIRPGRDYDVCQRCGTHFRGQTVRALGVVWGKHAPLLKNADVLENAISSDVLEG